MGEEKMCPLLLKDLLDKSNAYLFIYLFQYNWLEIKIRGDTNAEINTKYQDCSSGVYWKNPFQPETRRSK